MKIMKFENHEHNMQMLHDYAYLNTYAPKIVLQMQSILNITPRGIHILLY